MEAKNESASNKENSNLKLVSSKKNVRIPPTIAWSYIRTSLDDDAWNDEGKRRFNAYQSPDIIPFGSLECDSRLMSATFIDDPSIDPSLPIFNGVDNYIYIRCNIYPYEHDFYVCVFAIPIDRKTGLPDFPQREQLKTIDGDDFVIVNTEETYEWYLVATPFVWNPTEVCDVNYALCAFATPDRLPDFGGTPFTYPDFSLYDYSQTYSYCAFKNVYNLTVTPTQNPFVIKKTVTATQTYTPIILQINIPSEICPIDDWSISVECEKYDAYGKRIILNKTPFRGSYPPSLSQSFHLSVNISATSNDPWISNVFISFWHKDIPESFFEDRIVCNLGEYRNPPNCIVERIE